MFTSGYDHTAYMDHRPSIMTTPILLRMGNVRLLLLNWKYLWHEVIGKAILRLKKNKPAFWASVLHMEWGKPPSTHTTHGLL